MAKVELPKAYDPAEVEEKWYDYWLKEGFFHAGDRDPSRPTYSIVIPPPNVTGSLHMGHALNSTLQDILCRWKRMEGYNVLWMPGTDHAGIATQNVVEKELAKEGLTRHDLGREEFLKRVWQWKDKYGNYIIEQLKRLGASCDWKRTRFTMDEGFSKGVREVFVRLYEEGLIYRGDYMVNWCPRCHTALSDLEVEYQDEEGGLWYIAYPYEKGSGEVVVATTRPETLLGDTAVAVNPDDPKYRDIVGKRVILPLVEKPIPIVGDPYVDMEFGTGALKITPAHDPNDFEIGKAHGLDVVNVMSPDGTMNDKAGKYEGMGRFECRKAIVKDLEEKGLLREFEPYVHSVGHCYRCRTAIEPYISTQWFVKAKPLAEVAIRAVEEGRTRIIPDNWTKVYYEWMYNIRDWCISRQIWWGHQIPAWYCQDCGEVSVSREDISQCLHCSSENIERDPDVLDTWFSSALWPFGTMGWPDNNTPTLERFYPTSCLVTGFDILFFWVARMMMMGLKFMGDVPFYHVYIHALIRDEEGQKMSKTQGNVIDPLVMMDKYGTDAFRFTLAAFAAQGRDIRMSERRIEGYRHFVNKLWNASRFVLMNLEGYTPGDLKVGGLAPVHRWILSRLSHAVSRAHEALEGYEFDKYAGVIYQFTWHEFCDWYLEFAKESLYHGEGRERLIAQRALVTCLDAILKLAHPVMPFVIEEIWQHLPTAGKSIAVAPFPEPRKEWEDEGLEGEFSLVMDVISALRNIKAEADIPLTKRIKASVKASNGSLEVLQREADRIRALAFLDDLRIAPDVIRPPSSALAVLGGVEVYVPLGSLVDIEKEVARLEKELNKVVKELDRVSRKLSNLSFLKKAPSHVVEKDKRIRQELKAKKEKIASALGMFQGLG
jgi:valyl-tRNA synthetase